MGCTTSSNLPDDDVAVGRTRADVRRPAATLCSTRTDKATATTGDVLIWTRVATSDVACGRDAEPIMYVDGCTQTDAATVEVACGSHVPTTYVDAYTQTCVATEDVGCGRDAVFVDNCSQACVATSTVATGGASYHVDGFAQANVATCHVAPSVETEYVNGPTYANVVVRAAEKTMATQCYATEASVVPAASVATAKCASSGDMECGRPDTKAQNSTLYRTHKYWKMRYSLFSKFDEGIMLDEVSMYSVCPEILARHMAKRCSFGTVLDPFCGAGGNAIQLALTCNRVIAIDMDPKKIAMAKKNAEIYGVADRIDFRVGDSFMVAANIRADAVVTSPPWGGPTYERRTKFDPRELCSRESGGMAAIMQMSRKVAPRLVLHVPKNIDKYQCLQLAAKEGFSRIQYETVTIDKIPNCLNLYLTRNDTHERGTPVETSKEVNLNTPLLFGRKRMDRIRTDNLHMYASYVDWVTRSLNA